MKADLRSSSILIQTRILLITLSSVLILLLPLSAASYDLLVGTGINGSFSHYSARSFCRVIEKNNQDVSCKVIESGDEVDRLTNIQNGSLDLAFSDSQVISDSFRKKGPFEFLDIPYDRIRIIAPLYEVPVVFIVKENANILSCSDLQGKRINIGPPGSYKNQLFQQIMALFDWHEKDFATIGELSSTLSQDTIAFSQGNIQAMIHKGVHPDRTIHQLARYSKVQIIGLEDSRINQMLKNYPGMSVQTVNTKVYPLLSGPVVTFGTTVTLITSMELDDQTVQMVTGALKNNSHLLQTVHPALAAFTFDPHKDWFGGVNAHKAIFEQ